MNSENWPPKDSASHHLFMNYAYVAEIRMDLGAPAVDGDLGLENSHSSSETIRVQLRRNEFGHDLAHETFGQRVTGKPYRRGA